jgi:hypothetical protein
MASDSGWFTAGMRRAGGSGSTYGTTWRNQIGPGIAAFLQKLPRNRSGMTARIFLVRIASA